MIKLLNSDKIGDKYEMCLYDADYSIVFKDISLKAGNVVCLSHFIFKFDTWKKVILNGIDMKNSKGLTSYYFFKFFFKNFNKI